MTHPRTLVRRAIRAQLAANPTIAAVFKDRIFTSRYTPLGPKEVPALGISTHDEVVDEESYQTAPRCLDRILTVRIEVITMFDPVKNTKIDDDLDDLCELVERAMAKDECLDDTAGDSYPLSTSIMIQNEGEVAMASAVLTYTVEYDTNLPESTDELDDLKEIETRWNLSNAQNEPERAHDHLKNLDQ